MSSSKSSSQAYDQRVVGGDDSVNLSANVSGTGNSIEVTDRGAVQDSMALARAGIEAVERSAGASTAAAQGMFSGVLDQQREAIAAVKDAASKDTTTLVIAGLAVVGLAAATMLRK
jgi:hypothetical protein